MTSMATAGRFEGGRAVGAAFAVLGKRWLALATLYVCLSVAPLIAGTLLRPTAATVAHDANAFALYCAITVGLIIVGWFRDAAIVSVALQPAQAGSTLWRGLADAASSLPAMLPIWLIADAPAALPLWMLRTPTKAGASLATIGAESLLIAIGTWLLRVILTVIWGIVVPVVIAERRGTFASVARSVRLMTGARWPFLALYIVTQVVAAIPAILTGFVLAFVIATRGASAASVLQTERLLVLAPVLLAGIVGLVWYVVVATSYREMRRAHDGLPADDAADVFT